ncbi:MAG: pyruvate kinase [Acidiferrobacteraceae bacterium]|nr:pyruvate kinase [Acidiferrobacteraceae bacterium]
MRRTKIVASLGPSTDDAKAMSNLIRAGIDVARINLSHGSEQDHRYRADLVRHCARKRARTVGLLFDLQGPKIRVEGFRSGKAQLRNGKPFVIDTSLGGLDGTEERVGTTYKGLPHDVQRGDVLLLDDGSITLRVEGIDQHEVRTRVVVGGILSNYKGMNRQGGGLSAEALTDKDREDIIFAAELGADFVGISFVRNAEDIGLARELVRSAGSNAHIVAKIERREAVENIDSIIAAADVIMVARGDLGVELGDAELPGVQKRLIAEARAGNKIVITATQMMQSMVTSPQPTRAEVLDVANAVLDGTDAVMLSAETAVGRHPARVVAAMDRICCGAERHDSARVSTHRLDAHFETTEEAISMATMYTANHHTIAAILALTESGRTPMWMSRISSGIPIFAATRLQETERRLALYRGVYPVPFDAATVSRENLNWAAVEEIRKRGLVEEGDQIILTKGDHYGSEGGTNAMKIVRVGSVSVGKKAQDKDAT